MRVSKLLIAAVVLVALGGCLTVGPVSFSQPDHSGQPLLYADPGVKIERPGQGLIEYEQGLVLAKGDLIRTASGQAVIDFDNDNIVVLNTNTSIELGSIKLFLGEVFTRIKKLTRRGGGQVLTDEISASVSGTKFSVRRSISTTSPDDGLTQVIVRTGTVLCEPGVHGSWRPLSLSSNRMLNIGGEYRTEPEITSVDAEAKTRWAELAEERLLKPRSRAPDVHFVLPVLRPRRGGTMGDDDY